MKKIFVLILVSVILMSCGSPFDTTMKSDEYRIEVLSSWESVEWEGYDVFLRPEDKQANANVKIYTKSSAEIKWGRITEITEDYDKKAVETYGYTLESDGYEFVPQAQREQRYYINFVTEQNGMTFKIIQHIYATNSMAVYVTGTYIGGDKTLEGQVKDTMDSFLLAPKKGW